MKFSDTLIMQKIISKMHRGYSPVILAVGVQGTGKTMLSAKIAEDIHKVFHKGKWPCKEFTVFDMADFSYKFLNARKQTFVIAEAGFDLTFDEWFNKTNKFFDKIITTQRVMGNCYILNIPVGKDLGRRHRRKINYILKVKRHGQFDAIINRIKAEVMTGDEFKTFFLETYYHVPLPECFEELRKLDEDNKERIRTDLIAEYQEDQKKVAELKTMKKLIPSKITCGNCDHAWTPKVPKPRACPLCFKRLKYSTTNDNKKELIV